MFENRNGLIIEIEFISYSDVAPSANLNIIFPVWEEFNVFVSDITIVAFSSVYFDVLSLLILFDFKKKYLKIKSFLKKWFFIL